MKNKNMPEQGKSKKITITNIGKGFLDADTEMSLVNQLAAEQYRDAYYLDRSEGECWVFDYGVLVAWNMDAEDLEGLCSELGTIVQEPNELVMMEHYMWCVGQEDKLTIHNDKLTLPSDDHRIRLALSHAFAQSAKLGFFEDMVQKLIQNSAYIPEHLAETGKVPLTRKKLAKLRGTLLKAASDITLNFGLLDTPEFFWDYPELEEPYQKLAKYLDLQPRVDILNKKLLTIDSMLDMLAIEQNHKHSAFLEWVIIILIAADIMVYLF